MAASAPTFGQIRAQVANIRKNASDARVFGIHAKGRWAGQALQQFGDETVLYRPMRLDAGDAGGAPAGDARGYDRKCL